MMMRKIFNALLLLTVAVCFALTAVGCNCGGHQHDFNTLKSDGTFHWQECSCGERDGQEAHKGGVPTDVKKAVCEVCGAEYGNVVVFAEGLDYQLSSDESYYLVSGIGSFEGKELVVPAEHEGKPVKRIAKGAFAECDKLKNVIIAFNFEVVEEQAFASSSIESVVIGNGVKAVEKEAFRECNKLISAEISSSVNSLGSYAFMSCDMLSDIEVSKDNQLFKSVNGSLYSKDGSVLIQYSLGKSEEHFTIPEGVTTIGVAAFADSVKLKKVTLSKEISSICALAFADCKNLTVLEYPKTKADWTTVKTDANWNYRSGITETTCQDGNI